MNVHFLLLFPPKVFYIPKPMYLCPLSDGGPCPQPCEILARARGDVDAAHCGHSKAATNSGQVLHCTAREDPSHPVLIIGLTGYFNSFLKDVNEVS